ncbi:type II toxin-antitoxin system VapC family toxin [Rhizohabitans arisaemae]|uniref:type II toxin-antitoxin system VapC family toxin n=1 Tax=Rhizohabitans arisaemae TaxID=2720610 RepID=UPI0024B17495|nr:type II toxin-antitoxin system VapC family toxin [Rhizohabitans arisaemae]
MIVVDASALVEALTGNGAVGEEARSALAADHRWAAPSHLLLETVSVVRGRLLGHKISPAVAEEAIKALGDIVVDRVDESTLLHRIWDLRSNLTAYDAAYVAAAEALGCALITADGKLARSTGPRCEIRLLEGFHP